MIDYSDMAASVTHAVHSTWREHTINSGHSSPVTAVSDLFVDKRCVVEHVVNLI